MRTSAVFLALAAMGSVIAAPLDPLPAPQGVDKVVAGVDAPKDFHQDCTGGGAKCAALNGIGFHSANEVEGHLGKQEGVVTSGAGKVLAVENQPNLGNSVTKDGQKLKTEMQGRHYHETDGVLDVDAHAKRQEDEADSNEEWDTESFEDLDEPETEEYRRSCKRQEDEYDYDEGDEDGAEEGPDCSAGECASWNKRRRSQLGNDIKSGADSNWPADKFSTGGATIHQQGKAVQAFGDTAEGVTGEANRQFDVMAGAEKYHSGEFVNAVGV